MYAIPLAAAETVLKINVNGRSGCDGKSRGNNILTYQITYYIAEILAPNRSNKKRNSLRSNHNFLHRHTDQKSSVSRGRTTHI